QTHAQRGRGDADGDDGGGDFGFGRHVVSERVADGGGHGAEEDEASVLHLGSELMSLNMSWWMALEKMTSLESAGMKAPKVGWLKMMTAYPYMVGMARTEFTTPYSNELVSSSRCWRSLVSCNMTHV
ncbi:hypothetical protein PF010_g29627, partial [Phytophthora fragariae]